MPMKKAINPSEGFPCLQLTQNPPQPEAANQTDNRMIENKPSEERSDYRHEFVDCPDSDNLRVVQMLVNSIIPAVRHSLFPTPVRLQQ
jgi:hypothetical protein